MIQNHIIEQDLKHVIYYFFNTVGNLFSFLTYSWILFESANLKDLAVVISGLSFSSEICLYVQKEGSLLLFGRLRLGFLMGNLFCLVDYLRDRDVMELISLCLFSSAEEFLKESIIETNFKYYFLI